MEIDINPPTDFDRLDRLFIPKPGRTQIERYVNGPLAKAGDMCKSSRRAGSLEHHPHAGAQCREAPSHRLSSATSRDVAVISPVSEPWWLRDLRAAREGGRPCPQHRRRLRGGSMSSSKFTVKREFPRRRARSTQYGQRYGEPLTLIPGSGVPWIFWTGLVVCVC